MPLVPLHQVAQRATDLDRSVAFYRDVGGLELIARFDPPGLDFFGLGDTRLLLEAAAPAATLYFRVPDIGSAPDQDAAAASLDSLRFHRLTAAPLPSPRRSRRASADAR